MRRYTSIYGIKYSYIAIIQKKFLIIIDYYSGKFHGNTGKEIYSAEKYRGNCGKILKNMEKITQVMKCFMCNKKKEDFGLNGRLWT
jgi:lysyl-tRNA synthetase class I